MIRTTWFAGFFAIACASVLVANDAIEPAVQKPGPDEKPKAPMKDPTEPTGKLKEILTPQPKGGIPGAAPAAVYRMPTLAIKARVLAKGKAAAVIEVDGQTYSVSPDSTIVVGGLTLKVLEVSAPMVRIEAVQLKEVVVLN